jgi:hypothetical protein
LLDNHDHDPTDRGRERSKRNRIIPPDEDMRRLFQECKIGSGNAALLSQALAMATPEDLVSVVIKVRGLQLLLSFVAGGVGRRPLRASTARPSFFILNSIITRC